MKQFIYEIYNEDALNDCTRELLEYADTNEYQSLLFHIYCGINNAVWVTQVSERLTAELPNSILVGVSSHAEIKNGSLVDPVILVSATFFESTRIELFSYPDVLGKEKKIGRALRAILDTSDDVKAAELLMQTTPIDYEEIFENLAKSDINIPIFGAFPLSHNITGERHFVMDEKGIYDNGLLFITYSGRDFHINVGHTTGWESMGRTFTVTKAHSNVLNAVDDFPAYDLYKKYLDIDADDNFMVNAMEFPLFIDDDGATMLRTPSAVMEDGSLLMAGYMKDGMKVTMSYGDPNTIIQKVDERAEEVRQFKPQAILLYTCAMRKFFWNYFINNEMAPFEKLATTAGFCSGGEIERDAETGRILLHNVTMLTIAMREGDMPSYEPDEVKVDSHSSHGQTSLVQRLSKLVRATSEEMRQSFIALEEANEKLRIMATVDELTALCNRREIERRINEALDAAGADENRSVSLVMIDVDHFKNVNDTCGHETGDKILEGVAAVLNATVREYDGEAVGRWGGEEFFMLLPKSDLDEAMMRAEEIRQTVELYPFPKIDKLTVSLGVTITDGTEDKKAVYKRVDDALYEAKETGRNRIVVH